MIVARNPRRPKGETVETVAVVTFLSFFFLKQDLVDRFIMIDSEEKFHSLFNFEQSHHFGLRYTKIN